MADTPYDVLVAAVWRGEDVRADDRTLRHAFALAARNQVEGAFANVFRDRLREELAGAQSADRAFRRNLEEACTLLRRRGIEPILIKAPPQDLYTYGNFDLVVGEENWTEAIESLRTWARRFSTHPLERTKLLAWPESGPAAHLHQSVSWFDVPVIDAEALRVGAIEDSRVPALLPSDVDELRILLAHAMFQNLALDLAELLRFRRLLGTQVSVADATRRAEAEGWCRAFERAFRFAADTVGALDAGRLIRLPAPVPVFDAVAAGFEHAVNLVRRGNTFSGAREALLRLVLVTAKRRRMIFG